MILNMYLNDLVIKAKGKLRMGLFNEVFILINRSWAVGAKGLRLVEPTARRGGE